MNDAGVLPSYQGIIVHDCWDSYWKNENVTHSICCAHLLRELNGVEENLPEQTWAPHFKELLLTMKKAKETAIAAGIDFVSIEQLERFDKQYDDIIKTAYAKNPLPETPKPLIMSYIGTARKHGINPYEAIRSAISGNSDIIFN